MSNIDGTVLKYDKGMDTDVHPGMPFGRSKFMVDALDHWLHSVLQRPYPMLSAAVKYKGEGTYKGMRSRIYERNVAVPAGVNSEVPSPLVVQVEIVENAPLFLKQSIFQVDSNGGRVLVKSNSLLQFELLPEGSTLPSF